MIHFQHMMQCTARSYHARLSARGCALLFGWMGKVCLASGPPTRQMAAKVVGSVHFYFLVRLMGEIFV